MIQTSKKLLKNPKQLLYFVIISLSVGTYLKLGIFNGSFLPLALKFSWLISWSSFHNEYFYSIFQIVFFLKIPHNRYIERGRHTLINSNLTKHTCIIAAFTLSTDEKRTFSETCRSSSSRSQKQRHFLTEKSGFKA